MKPLKLFFFLVFFIFPQFVVAQASVPFQDPDGAYWGLKDSVSNEILLKPVCNSITRTNDKEIFVAVINRKYGLINKRGIKISLFKYDFLESKFNYGLIKAFIGRVRPPYMHTANGLFGLVSKSGKEIISLKYNYLRKSNIKDGTYYEVGFGSRHGLIDSLGNEISGYKFEVLNTYENGLIKVKENSINSTTKNKGKIGFINTKAEIIIPLIYDKADHYLNSNACRVLKNGEWYYIDKKGGKLRKDYPDGLYMKKKWLTKKIKYGYQNQRTETKIKPQYDFVRKLNDSMYAGLKGVYQTYKTEDYSVGKWVLLDYKGREISEQKYDYISSLKDKNYVISNRYVTVSEGYKNGVLDKNGEVIVEMDFQYFWYLGNNKFKTIRNYYYEPTIKGKVHMDANFSYEFGPNNKYRLVDNKENVLSAYIYDEPNLLDKSTLTSHISIEDTKNSGAYSQKYFRGLIDKNGKVILPLKKYLQITLIESNGIKRILVGILDSLINKKKYFLINPSGDIISKKYDEITKLRNGIFKVANQGRFGLINLNGKEVVPLEYRKMFEIVNNQLLVKNLNFKNGIITFNNHEIVPVKYSNVDLTKNVYEADSYLYSKNGKLLSNTENRINTITYEDAKIIIVPKLNSPYRYPYSYGVIDKKEDTIIPTIYHDIKPLENGLYIVSTNDMSGVLDSKGQVVLPISFTSVYPFYDFYRVTKRVDNNSRKVKFGVYSKTGELLVPLLYNNIVVVSDSTVVVQLDGKSKLINIWYGSSLSKDYDKIIYNNNTNSFQVELEGKKGTINSSGKEIIPVKYDKIDTWHQFSLVTIEGKKGMYHNYRGSVIPTEYDEIIWGNYKNGLIYLFKGEIKNESNYKGKWIVADTNGEQRNNQEYNYFNGFSSYYGFKTTTVFKGTTRLNTDSYAKMTVPCKGKYGVLNIKGEEIVKLEYDYIPTYLGYRPLIPVFKGEVDTNGCLQKGKWGFVSNRGERLTRLKYDWVSPFHQLGLTITFKGNTINGNPEVGSYGIVDYLGREIIKPSYQYIFEFKERIAIVKLKGKYGYINEEGKEIAPCIYSKVSPFKKGKALVDLHGEVFFINREGVRIKE